MPFQIRKEVVRHEWLLRRQFQGREARAIVRLGKLQAGRREELIEDAALRVVCSFKVGYAAVVIDRQVLNVAAVAADLIERREPLLSDGSLFVAGGLEVVQEIKLLEVDQC